MVNEGWNIIEIKKDEEDEEDQKGSTRIRKGSIRIGNDQPEFGMID